jgi:hypothetical protein
MAGKPTCLVCQKEMVRGFITDFRHTTTLLVPRWCKGDPEKGMFTVGDAKISQADEGLKVVAYRCPECEALRLYAPSAE